MKAAVGSGASLGAAMLGAAYGRAGRGGADKVRAGRRQGRAAVGTWRQMG